MDWKDTVMARRIYEGDNTYEERAKQAEISFKAGMEEESTQAYHAGLHDGILRGRREVVEWVKYCPQCGSYIPKNLNDTRTLECRICDWSGQDKLKDWGL
ncbi:hypothetical protein LCGC14_2293520 [marine sediment metagenome]|uniref:Uncharacterized protein n=1 Tax=marine sediment metagenome TaxID=412755 RepID=A0A0F9CR13_9ZZZZ